MKNFLQRATSVVAVCSLFAFSACESEEIAPDASLQASNTQDARSSKSFNLHKTYTADIMSLNDSGVMGTATLTLEGDMLTVHIMASGLEPGMLHPQHIHGFMDSNKNAVCPPMSADMNGDGFIDLTEGAPFYGPVLLPLEPFPTAPDGTIDYKQTFEVTANMLPLQNNVIVLHGMTVEGLVENGMTLPEQYVATLPVACGEIKPANMKKMKK
ncbi:hypothetical protein ACFSRY_14540 [Pontibacter locisalis]|uniref:CHRD domain-containing protein n=1 Tax=Pontibacter locisalis TaxID=1719035 RepID=A0ABW5ISV3_9BACT